MLFGAAALVAAVLVAGCGGSSDQPELGAVSGVVTLDGKPLPGATVTFIPETGRSSFGVTEETGRYEPRYTNDAMGAKVGSHKVSVSTKTEGLSNESGGPDVPATPERVPARYRQDSTLTETIEPGQNAIDFELQSSEA